MPDRAELEALYRRYNDACNDHRFDDLGEFVADDVMVDGTRVGLEAYKASLEAVVRAFEDYRWEITGLVIEEPWIAARFHTTGTHTGTFLGVPATGRAVTTRELAMYRVEDGKWAEVWGTADDVRLLEQIRTPG